MQEHSANKILHSLLDRQWATLALELILLVAGILIALGIDGWSADRADRRSERAYLELLVRDLGQIETQLRDQIAFETAIAGKCVALYTLIQGENPAEHSEQIGQGLTDISVRRTLFLDSAAYTDLTSTGNLGLIQDRKLRDQIIRYFSDARRRVLIVEKNNRYFVDELFLPFVINFGVSHHAAEDESARLPEMSKSIQSMQETFSPQMLHPVDQVLLLPRDAPQWSVLERQLTWRGMISVTAKDQVISILDATVQLREALESALANR